MGLCQIGSGDPFHLNALSAQGFAPLFLDGLALARRQICQKAIEIVVTLVFPVKLLIGPLQIS